MKYKLIKRFPGSPPLGTIVEQYYPDPDKEHFCYKGTYASGMSFISFTRARDQIEGFEEFWQPIFKSWKLDKKGLTAVYYYSDDNLILYTECTKHEISKETLCLLVNDPFKVDEVAGFKLNRIYMYEVIDSDSNLLNSFIIPIGECHVEDFVEGYLIGCQYVSYKRVKEIYEWIKSN